VTYAKQASSLLKFMPETGLIFAACAFVVWAFSAALAIWPLRRPALCDVLSALPLLLPAPAIAAL
jgi:hypothetical protein